MKYASIFMILALGVMSCEENFDGMIQEEIGQEYTIQFTGPDIKIEKGELSTNARTQSFNMNASGAPLELPEEYDIHTAVQIWENGRVTTAGIWDSIVSELTLTFIDGVDYKFELKYVVAPQGQNFNIHDGVGFGFYNHKITNQLVSRTADLGLGNGGLAYLSPSYIYSFDHEQYYTSVSFNSSAVPDSIKAERQMAAVEFAVVNSGSEEDYLSIAGNFIQMSWEHAGYEPLIVQGDTTVLYVFALSPYEYADRRDVTIKYHNVDGEGQPTVTLYSGTIEVNRLEKVTFNIDLHSANNGEEASSNLTILPWYEDFEDGKMIDVSF